MEGQSYKNYKSKQQGPPKREGYAPSAFFIMMVLAIILAIVLIIMIILYFRKNANLIDPANCPELVTGLVATPNAAVTTAAQNCGTVVDCTYTINSLLEASQICLNLGTAKCKAFSIQQQPLSNQFTMTVSDSTALTSTSGSDAYRIVM